MIASRGPKLSASWSYKATCPNPDAAVPDDESKEQLRALIQAMRHEMPTGQGVEIERCGPLDARHFGCAQEAA